MGISITTIISSYFDVAQTILSIKKTSIDDQIISVYTKKYRNQLYNSNQNCVDCGINTIFTVVH